MFQMGWFNHQLDNAVFAVGIGGVGIDQVSSLDEGSWRLMEEHECSKLARLL